MISVRGFTEENSRGGEENVEMRLKKREESGIITVQYLKS